MTREEAMARYRAAWASYVLCGNAEMRWALGDVMDTCQEAVASHPLDPEWLEFTATLPGFREFWADTRAWALTAIRMLDEGDEP